MAMDALAGPIERVRRRFSGRLGVAARHLGTGEEIRIDDRHAFPTASTFKVPLLYEVFQQADAGAFSLEDRIALGESERVPGSGVLRDLQGGLQPTVRDLCMLMIIVSDNTATNMLLDLVGGPEAVNVTMRDLGLTSIEIRGKIDFSRLEHDSAVLAVASPADLLALAVSIGQGTAVSPTASAGMLAILRRQHYLNQFPRFFAYNPYGPELGEPQPIWVANKTGSLPGVRADTGLVGLPTGDLFAFAVMSEESADRGFTGQNENEIAIGAIGRLLLEAWWPADVGPAPLLDSPVLDALLG